MYVFCGSCVAGFQHLFLWKLHQHLRRYYWQPSISSWMKIPFCIRLKFFIFWRSRLCAVLNQFGNCFLFFWQCLFGSTDFLGECGLELENEMGLCLSHSIHRGGRAGPVQLANLIWSRFCSWTTWFQTCDVRTHWVGPNTTQVRAFF